MTYVMHMYRNVDICATYGISQDIANLGYPGISWLRMRTQTRAHAHRRIVHNDASRSTTAPHANSPAATASHMHTYTYAIAVTLPVRSPRRWHRRACRRAAKRAALPHRTRHETRQRWRERTMGGRASCPGACCGTSPNARQHPCQFLSATQGSLRRHHSEGTGQSLSRGPRSQSDQRGPGGAGQKRRVLARG